MKSLDQIVNDLYFIAGDVKQHDKGLYDEISDLAEKLGHTHVSAAMTASRTERSKRHD